MPLKNAAHWLIRLAQRMVYGLDTVIRAIDGVLGGTATLPFFRGRSLFAFLLPLPVYAFIVLGPSLSWSIDGSWSWRGGASSALLLAGAFLVQTVYFVQRWWSGMAWLHFWLIGFLAASTLFIGAGKRPLSDDIYQHYYGVLAFVALLAAVPFANWLRKRKIALLPAETIAKFKANTDHEKITDQGTPREFEPSAFWAAMVLALKKPLHVLTPVALFAVASSSQLLYPGTIIILVISYFSIAANIFDPERDALVGAVERLFLTGGSLIVTLAITVIAALRLSGVDYITTILDTGSNRFIFSYVLSTYALFWLYDFWVNQATLDIIGKRGEFYFRPELIGRHGGGRLAVFREKGGGKKRIFKPAALLVRIADKAGEDVRDDLREKAGSARRRFVGFTLVCSLLFLVMYVASAVFLHNLDPEAIIKAGKDANTETGTPAFDLARRLQAPDGGPAIMLAASGGGTRAALYTASVLRGLHRLGRLDQLVLASGVSGGSAALAYFGAHRQQLIDGDDDDWRLMSDTLAMPFIDDVIAGAADGRIAAGHRLGLILAESFEKRFLEGATGEGRTPRKTIGEIDDFGLIINTSLCGSEPVDTASRERPSAEYAGGRLVITNLSSRFGTAKPPEDYGWPLAFPYVIVRSAGISLFKAASASANFPPVFSNAAIEIEGTRYWVTDGGAVENRGVLSLLRVLREELTAIRQEAPDKGVRTPLAPIRLVVADASAFQPLYRSDRGLGAKMSAGEKMANSLIRKLTDEVALLHREISGEPGGFGIVHVPMPEAFRIRGSFGTHWKMPAAVKLAPVLRNGGRVCEIEVDREGLKNIIAGIFSDENGAGFKGKPWDEDEEKSVRMLIAASNELWHRLKTGLE